MDGWQQYLQQALDLTKVAVGRYWDFMGTHWYLGSILTILTWNSIARLIRGPRPIVNHVDRSPADDPNLALAQQVAQLTELLTTYEVRRSRPSSQTANLPEPPSRYDVLLSTKDD